jgi:hypothetical protein
MAGYPALLVIPVGDDPVLLIDTVTSLGVTLVNDCVTVVPGVGEPAVHPGGLGQLNITASAVVRPPKPSQQAAVSTTAAHMDLR